MIGKTNAIGVNNSDASLNFSFITSEVEPVGKENLIWLKTSAEIAGWVFQSEVPTNVPQNTVWIKIGTSSTIAFNAVKGDNILKVYPIYCKLYDGSAWNDVEAEIYQNGWKSWSLIIFVPDEDHENMFESKAILNHTDESRAAKAPTVSYNDSYLQVSISNELWPGQYTNYKDGAGLIVTKESIPLSNYTKVKFQYEDFTRTITNGGVYFFAAPSSQVAPAASYEVQVDPNISSGTIEMNIPSSLNNAYMGVEIYSNGTSLNSVSIKITQITAI